ncbi:MAG: aminotransferase class V-fold PLP-dependent enzyme [Clostridia bacterium]|nr:aminotransferase class V-fold PLP-dependent enzyme [Clostridia bacterium]
MIYFDNAATTGKKPISVIKAVENALLNLSANPGRSGHTLSERAATQIYAVREKTAEFFGASGAENVVFTANCTASLNFVIKGVLKRGDHCIISDLEHNAVLRPVHKCGADYDIARVSLTDDNITVENFEKLINPRTKMIICTGGSNVIGRLLPIEKIGGLTRDKNILFAVDAAQIAGVIPIDMKRMNIDYLCIASHKGLYAPMGTGILIAEKPIENTLIEGGTGTNSKDLFQPDFLPERLESGTVNVAGIIGTGAGIDFVKRVGVDKIHRKEINLLKRLYNRIYDKTGVILYAPKINEDGFAPVLSFDIKGLTSSETASLLNDRGIAVRAGLHCAPLAHKKIGTIDNGTVRVSPSFFNSEAEIDYLSRKIEEIGKKYNKYL